MSTSPTPDDAAKTSDSASTAPEGAWQDLFDGTTVAGLRGYGRPDFPADRWTVTDGRLTTVPGPSTDLITEATFRDFEVEFEWTATPGGNSGLIYRVVETDQPSWTTGPEYQVLDDAVHPDGSDPATSAGSLYALIAPDPTKQLAPAGAPNRGRLLVRSGRVEHWLNDRLVVAYDWDGPDVRRLIQASKFAGLDGFMRADDGHVVLQHHGEEVAYTRVRIRALTDPPRGG